MLIAYLMWKDRLSYDTAYLRVKSIRGIVNPNLGFVCQVKLIISCLEAILMWGRGGGGHQSLDQISSKFGGKISFSA